MFYLRWNTVEGQRGQFQERNVDMLRMQPWHIDLGKWKVWWGIIVVEVYGLKHLEQFNIFLPGTQPQWSNVCKASMKSVGNPAEIEYSGKELSRLKLNRAPGRTLCWLKMRYSSPKLGQIHFQSLLFTPSAFHAKHLLHVLSSDLGDRCLGVPWRQTVVAKNIAKLSNPGFVLQYSHDKFGMQCPLYSKLCSLASQSETTERLLVWGLLWK